MGGHGRDDARRLAAALGRDPDLWLKLRPGRTYRLDPGASRSVPVMPAWDIKGTFGSLTAALDKVWYLTPGASFKVAQRRVARAKGGPTLWYRIEEGGGWVRSTALLGLGLTRTK